MFKPHERKYYTIYTEFWLPILYHSREYRSYGSIPLVPTSTLTGQNDYVVYWVTFMKTNYKTSTITGFFLMKIFSVPGSLNLRLRRRPVRLEEYIDLVTYLFPSDVSHSTDQD